MPVCWSPPAWFSSRNLEEGVRSRKPWIGGLTWLTQQLRHAPRLWMLVQGWDCKLMPTWYSRMQPHSGNSISAVVVSGGGLGRLSPKSGDHYP